ncbi:MAG: family 10 glycosylhydrolase [Candidatus Latescibacterota bacterium]
MPGIALNEDNSHFFFTRTGQTLDGEAVAAWVDQYAGTQVHELLLSPNAMRTSFDSAVWDPIWAGYDPEGPDDQPLLASTPPEGRAGARAWVHTAWDLARRGIDVYAVWIERARQRGLSPWLSMRMNDLHGVDDEACFMHSAFWRQHPEHRRVPYRFTAWQDRALDYGKPEVRRHHMALIEELAQRYDCDGVELDWMRFGYHFRPGHEEEGAALLTQFTAEARRCLDGWEQRRGHRIRLGARVPSRPQTALGLGMDAVTWARQGLVDWLVVTPFWASVETDMPIEVWRGLLEGTGVTLCAGLEVLLRPCPSYPAHPLNSLETVRGAAAAMLQRGADRVYLFNYMDGQTAMANVERDYGALLRQVGSLETLAGKPRRHVLTFADTWAPGEPQAHALPAAVGQGRWHAFRLATGPAPAGPVTVVLGVQEGPELQAGILEVRLNGEVCGFLGAAALEEPKPTFATWAFRAPDGALRGGTAVVEVLAHQAVTLGWVEIDAA